MSKLIANIPDSYDERADIARRIDNLMRDSQSYFATKVIFFENALIIDAQGDRPDAWMAIRNGVIEYIGSDEHALQRAKQSYIEQGISLEIVDTNGSILCPGYIDIHAHGAWGSAFDDGEESIMMARAFHMLHGTTRQVLSLITNPWDILLTNIRMAAQVVHERDDILGLHLEGPFLSPQRKGAHDELCLLDPTGDKVDAVLEAAEGTLRQITIAPELEHGISAIEQFSNAGVVAAVGHCDANYEQALDGFNHGARIMTHMFNAMNGISHRSPGPIAAAVEKSDVVAEIIADGFHVQVPALRIATQLVPHRLALVTDSMAAAGCPDGSYRLGHLDVTVVDGHARLVSNGAIAGSTLNLEEAVQRMVHEVGLSKRDAIEAATYAPARAVGVSEPNNITRRPLGLLREGYAADVLMLETDSLEIQRVWCNGIEIGI